MFCLRNFPMLESGFSHMFHVGDMVVIGLSFYLVCCQRVPASLGHPGHGGTVQQKAAGQEWERGQRDTRVSQGLGDVPCLCKLSATTEALE